MEGIKFYGSWTIDIVGFTKNSLESQKDIMRIVNKAVKYAEQNLHEKMRILYRSDTGDGWMIIVPHEETHWLIQFTHLVVLQLNEENVKRQEKIFCRIAIHVDLGYKIDEQEEKISGEVLNKLKRILDLGYAGDILLSETAVSIIEAENPEYVNHFYYAGRYPIKHGYMIEIWRYYHDKIGNAKRPKRKRTALFIYITKKNKSIAISLIILSVIGTILTGVSINAQQLAKNEISDINTTLQNKFLKINANATQTNKAITRILQDAYDNNNDNLTGPVKLSQLWDHDVISKVNVIIKNVSDINRTDNKDIKYAWVAEPFNCIIKSYTFGNTFENITGEGKDWCINKSIGSYLADTLYATGEKLYSNVLVSPITIYDNNNSPFPIALFGESINWHKVFSPIIGKEQKLLLLDKKGNLAASCKDGSCQSLVTKSDFTNYYCTDGKCYYDENKTQYHPKLNPTKLSACSSDNIINYINCSIDNYIINYVFIQELTDIYKPSIYDHFFTNWKLVVYSDLDIISYKIQITLFIVSILLLAIIVYYYLIPRHWLEDINEIKRIDNKK